MGRLECDQQSNARKSDNQPIMPHDLIRKLPCDASKMIQLSQKRKVKGLRKRHAQLERAIKAVNSSMSITSSETKRQIQSERIRLESDLKSLDQTYSNKFLTETNRSICMGGQDYNPFTDHGSVKFDNEDHANEVEVRINLGTEMNQRNDKHFTQDLSKKPVQ